MSLNSHVNHGVRSPAVWRLLASAMVRTYHVPKYSEP